MRSLAVYRLMAFFADAFGQNGAYGVSYVAITNMGSVYLRSILILSYTIQNILDDYPIRM